jgi:manganese transport protein
MPPPPPPPSATWALDATPSAPSDAAAVAVRSRSFARRLIAFSGPGYLVAVGYMDPGNWATGLDGGAAYGYRLLFVVLLANLAAMFLQGLAAKLGLVTGLDLAQACRRAYGRRTTFFLWTLCELAIVACDLAELIGAAIALKLLFGLPLGWGVVLTGVDVLLLLALQRRGMRALETVIILLMLLVGGCFAVELCLARPDLHAIGRGLIPDAAILHDPAMLYLAVGILGATVMPHNLYLHSALVQAKARGRSRSGMHEAIRFARIDVVAALTLAILVNAGIVILAAATFGGRDLRELGLEDAYRLLAPSLGAGLASTLFAVALLAAGQNASITGTLAGQIVMEGFTDLRLPPWLRRLATRLLALVPATAAIVVLGDEGANRLLILSQVVLSLQLPFAVYPLVRLTGRRAWMGDFANGPATAAIAWTVTAALIGLNATLLLMALS